MTTTDYPFILADDLRPGDVYADGLYTVVHVDPDHTDGVVVQVQFRDGGYTWRSWERGQKAIGLTRPKES